MAAIKRGWERLLRWPIVIVVLFILLLELLLYILLRLMVIASELLFGAVNRAYFPLKSQLRKATEFSEWCDAARQLDKLEHREQWKSELESPYYDYALIGELIKEMQYWREKGDYRALESLLRTIYSTSNIGGINNEQLYQETYFGTKKQVEDFVQEVLESTIVIRDSSLPLDERLEFFAHARASYGRTALLLSGGAGMGYYHLGVLKTLVEAKCLPTVLSGASAGSLIASLIAVRTDQELQDFFKPELACIFTSCCEPFLQVRLRRLLTKGYMFDVEQWKQALRPLTFGDTTFREAYARTGRILNITLTSTGKYHPATVLNYRTAPDVVIWSAVLASSAFPRVIAPVELLAKHKDGQVRPFHIAGKKWQDGTVKIDIPIKEIAKMWDANFFIVSQVNPHVIPFFYEERGSTGMPARRHGSKLRGGFVAAFLEKFLKLEMTKWLQLLGQLDLLPSFMGADWRYVFLQHTRGTVTIVPAATVSDYVYILTDPSVERMRRFLLEGERATWSKLGRIANHYRFERLLRDCHTHLDKLSRHQISTQAIVQAAESDGWSARCEYGAPGHMIAKHDTRHGENSTPRGSVSSPEPDEHERAPEETKRPMEHTAETGTNS